MIAADTNVLARFILDDDSKQSAISREFLEKHTQEAELYLSPFMILELAWLLKSKGLVRHQIITILDKLIHADGVTVGQKNIVVAALDLYANHNISFADCLISTDAFLTANAKLATFDQNLCKVDARCISP